MLFMIILLILGTILSISSLLYGLIFINYLPDHYYIFHGIVGLFIVAFGSLLCSSINYRYPSNNVSDFKIPYKKIESMDFYVTKNKSIYTIKFDKYTCDLDLKGYTFPLLYVKAFLIRNIRFIEVSNRLPYIYVFKSKIKMTYCKIKNATIIYKNKKYNIVKNYISKASFIINLINYSGHYNGIEYHKKYKRPSDPSDNIIKINEGLYGRNTSIFYKK